MGGLYLGPRLKLAVPVSCVREQAVEGGRSKVRQKVKEGQDVEAVVAYGATRTIPWWQSKVPLDHALDRVSIV